MAHEPTNPSQGASRSIKINYTPKQCTEHDVKNTVLISFLEDDDKNTVLISFLEVIYWIKAAVIAPWSQKMKFKLLNIYNCSSQKKGKANIYSYKL